MLFDIVVITIAYVALATLLLLVLINLPWRLSTRAAAIVLAAVLSFTGYRALIAITGWPALAKLPERFELISSIVREPDGGTEDGAIFLWITSDESGGTPRAFRLDYDKSLHQRVSRANGLLGEGQRISGRGASAAGGSGAGRPGAGGVTFAPIKKRGLPPKSNTGSQKHQD